MTVLGIPQRRLGLWFTKTEIAFALVEPDGHLVMRGRTPRTPSGRAALLDTFPPNLEVVAIIARRSPRRTDPILELVSAIGTPCWYVREDLIEAVRLATGIDNAPPELSAALLACMPAARDGITEVRPSLSLFPRSRLGDHHGNM